MSQLQLDKIAKHKIFAPIYKDILNLTDFDAQITNIDFQDSININGTINEAQAQQLKAICLKLKPWRKGPFQIFDLFIDSEWQSFKKFNILKNHLDIEGKSLADIGCNNAYYLFQMLPLRPKTLIGFDPSINFYLQFLLLNHFIKSDIRFELLGIEHLLNYSQQFDHILCCGVLYHRKSPLDALKMMYQSLKKDGTLILDSLIIQDEKAICLIPESSYCKMSNVYFVPSLIALKHWLQRVGFKQVQVIDIVATTLQEQRKTQWIDGQSLQDFIKDDDTSIEGYPAPIRAYIKAKKV